MTKEERERIENTRRLALRRYEDSNEGGQMYYTLRDDIPLLFAALEEALQERDNWENDARERQRNTEFYQSLIDEIGGHFGEVAFIRDDGSKSDSILRAKVPELVERLQIRYGVVCEERDALKAELQAWRDGGLTEEILRRNDGTIKVGSGCRFVYEQYIKDTEAEITALRADLDDLKRQHRDCREQKEALRERCETLELGYRGFP